MKMSDEHFWSTMVGLFNFLDIADSQFMNVSISYEQMHLFFF